MKTDPDFTCIETDLFLFEVPEGYQIEELDDQAELTGPNDEFLVVSSYTVDEDSSMDELDTFAENIADAMRSAVEEPGLVVSEQLNRQTTESGLLVWSIKAEAEDKSHFFDQYSIVEKSTAVVATIEGNYEDRANSALIEEAVHALEFK